MTASPFHRLGPDTAATPVVIAVPHAGRYYPPEMVRAVRVPVDRLSALEDRRVDLVIADAVAHGAVAIVADVARAWIDLNRDPREIDPGMIAPAPAPDGMGEGPRIRAGLGLVPRRLAGAGEIWRARIASADLADRIATVHAPYHAAVAGALAEARARHGTAILLDCHSMPPLSGPEAGARVVLGDLNGATAGSKVIAAALDAARDHGLCVRHNHPYAGGYSIAHHGRPRNGVHAVQLELCRTLYLDRALRSPGAGLANVRAFVAGLAHRLAASIRPDLIAAE